MGNNVGGKKCFEDSVIIIEKDKYASIDGCTLYKVTLDKNDKETKTKFKWSEIKDADLEEDFYVECSKEKFAIEIEHKTKNAIVATKFFID